MGFLRRNCIVFYDIIRDITNNNEEKIEISAKHKMSFWKSICNLFRQSRHMTLVCYSMLNYISNYGYLYIF